ncbi:MAG: hypothetical protein HYT73_03495 [Candidatus Aenigmarchaeota archaeon]|nr:hypothetical protein [Candidatus Aenigmarchaeota archaeon]
MNSSTFYVDTADHVGLALKVRRAVVEVSRQPDNEVYTVYQRRDGVHEYFIKGDIELSVESNPTYAYVGHDGRGVEVIVCDTLGQYYERTVDLVAGICGKREESKTLPPS